MQVSPERLWSVQFGLVASTDRKSHQHRKDIKSQIAGRAFDFFNTHSPPPFSTVCCWTQQRFRSAFQYQSVLTLLGWRTERGARLQDGSFFAGSHRFFLKPTVVSTNNSHQSTAPKLHLLRHGLLIRELGITSTSAICHLDHLGRRRPTLSASRIQGPPSSPLIPTLRVQPGTTQQTSIPYLFSNFRQDGRKGM